MSSMKENFPLLKLNTFHVAVSARYFAELVTDDQMKDILHSEHIRIHPLLVLGGGSNILFTRDFDGLILHPVIRGIEIIENLAGRVKLRAGAGEIWDDFVSFCVLHGFGGIENLSMIPGTVGACPVQNIGAYGVEVKDYIESVEGYFIPSGQPFHLYNPECRFGYRDSVFKNELKGKVLITHVTFSFSLHSEMNTSYPDLKKELENYTDITIEHIRKAIMDIRSRKLPDPEIAGNAGSFFKNPVINLEVAQSLQKYHPGMPLYKQSGNMAKLSAAWLIDQCGWKGAISGNTGTHASQPLIVINRGGASGSEILAFAEKIRQSVEKRFGISIEMEVNIV